MYNLVLLLERGFLYDFLMRLFHDEINFISSA
jgi:hypothetical protein